MALYTDADDNNDESTGCGIGSWRPKWLHRWTTPRVFLFLFALEGIFQGGSYMYVVASLTTLEKRYAFGSLVSGTILLADDVSGLIFRPLFGYLANKVHRPRAVAWGMMIVSFGCFVATIPYMIYGPGVHMLGTTLTNKTSIEFCDSNRDVDSSCAGSDGTRSAFIPVMFIWMATALNGIGNAAFWTIGVPFIDDSVKKKNSPIFISLVFRVKRLLKNPILISYLMGNILRLFGVLGYMSFKPKYMESQYKQTASKANLFTGIIGIVPSATGVLLGGVFIKYLQPGPKALTSFVGIVEVFGTLGYISGLFLGCPPTPFAALPINNANNTRRAIVSVVKVWPQRATVPPIVTTAFIPYPLVYGAVINTACEVWESKCGKTGNCLVYDSDKFRNRLHGLTLTLYFLGSALDVIVVFLSSRIKNLYDDEEEDNDDNNVNNDHNIESETIN
ncbi:unnamed protein product [Medioppia subpectinata]|uniref:Uncharacterized protein n=1 Tax=Medioppia subpectinata TaxID=1979941 RepID=A0A7R9KK09_9ACAR|nr:unnamed protein product [Medioppia subpectinata]CAG2103693.1 unnamed protein product [Medioppia subpectinata]